MKLPGKTYLYSLLAVLALALVLSVSPTQVQATPTFEQGKLSEIKAAPHLKQLKFQILSITCPACAYAMSTKISERPGVRYVKIDMIHNGGANTEVIYDSLLIQPDDIFDVLHEFHFSEAAVKEADWQPKTQSNEAEKTSVPNHVSTSHD